MASKALQAFRRTVAVDWPTSAAADARKRLVQIAREGHAEIMRAQGNPAWDAYANTPGNRNLDSVVLPGPIVYTYSSVRRIVEVALAELQMASPVLSGDYVRSHTVFVNGQPVEGLPDNLKPSDEVIIANPVAYARKIEIGKTESGRDFVIQVPNRIYERVAKNKLVPRFRNVAKISFGYVIIPEAYRLRKDNAARSWLANKGRWYIHPTQRRDRAKGVAVQSPAIFISHI